MIFSDIVNGVASSEGTNSKLNSTKKAENTSTLDVNDFLQLLVAQMQYQDPLEPTDNTQYISQMATFTQVEATTDMGNRVEQQMATSLVGQSVIMASNKSSTGIVAGVVDYWELIDGTVYLGIGGELYDIADLDTVIDEKYFDKITGGSSSGGSTSGGTSTGGSSSEGSKDDTKVEESK